MTTLEQKKYPIGPMNCNYEEFCTILEKFPPLKNIRSANAIHGPFDGKINSIYRIDWDQQKSVIFRTRISKAFRYEPIVKEKILYPLLDGTLSVETQNLYPEIQKLSNKREGDYIFTKENPSIIPMQDLLYYYEPQNQIKSDVNTESVEYVIKSGIFPYLLTIKEFLPGKSFFDILKATPQEQLNSPAILSIFEKIGENLAKLHSIQFDGFYNQITDIGNDEKPTWAELFRTQWDKNYNDAKQYPAIQSLLPQIEKYFEKNVGLAEADTEAVLFHNDYQSQNIILSTNDQLSYDSVEKFEITGFIDFDNWRIGPRAQDFVKMEYWTINGNETWLQAFYSGYSKIYQVSTEMKTRINLYKMLWFLLVYAFEMDKIKKKENNVAVDVRFPAAEIYLDEIRKIVEN